MFKKILGITLIITILLTFLIGCKDTTGDSKSQVTSSESQSKTESKPDPVNLTLAHAQGEWIWPVLEEMNKKYTEKTGNTVELIYVPAEGFQDWVKAQMIAGIEPDIIWGLGTVADYFAEGKVVDLKNYYNEKSPYSNGIWKESFLDGVLGGVVDPIGGEAMLGMPLAQVTVNLFYNRDIFNELGLPDKAPETWSDVLNICEKVSASKPDVVPYAVMNGMGWNISWMMPGILEDVWVSSDILEKLDIINVNGKLDQPELVLGIKTGLIKMTDQRMVDAYNLIKNLAAYFNTGFNSMFWEYEKFFNEGNAAMQVNGSWYFNQHMTSDFSVNYGVGLVPYVDKSLSTYSLREGIIKTPASGGSTDLVITEKARKDNKLEAAVDYFRYLSDPESGAKYFVEGTLFLPVVKGVDVPEVMKPAFDLIGDESGRSKLELWNLYNFTPELDKAYQENFKAFLEDKSITTEAFLQKLQPIFEAAAEQYIKEKPEMKVQDFIDKVK